MINFKFLFNDLQNIFKRILGCLRIAFKIFCNIIRMSKQRTIRIGSRFNDVILSSWALFWFWFICNAQKYCGRELVVESAYFFTSSFFRTTNEICFCCWVFTICQSRWLWWWFVSRGADHLEMEYRDRHSILFFRWNYPLE